jgi:L-ectoine synthase
VVAFSLLDKILYYLNKIARTNLIMIVRTLNDIAGTKREKLGEGYSSHRLLLKEDGMGFALTETRSAAGLDMIVEYKNHLEAVYCLEGEGTVEDLTTGVVHAVTPGTLYALNNHERHRLKITKDMRVICVFNPPVTGQEVFDENGSWPLLE